MSAWFSPHKPYILLFFFFFRIPSIFSTPHLQRNVSFNATVMTDGNQSSLLCVHTLDAAIFTVLHLQEALTGS